MSERLPPGAGIAVLVIPMPGNAEPPTDSPAAMIAWLYRHGAPRTGEVLRRLERHGWTIEPPDPAAATQTALWASADFADVEQARAAARPFVGRIDDRMRWGPADRAAVLVPVAEPPGADPPGRL
jgi:hypothetical protein